MSADSLNSSRRRRTYTRQFKAEMVAQCLQGDVSLASLAVEHGMNPNVLHRWVTEHERYGHHILSDDDRHEQGTTALRVSTPQSITPFLPVPLSPSQSPVGNETVRLELKRGATTVCVSWAGERRSAVRRAPARVVAVIRIDQIWLAVDPVDMRSGMDRLLARVVEVFGASQPHHAYLFANRRGTRLKVLVCDGFGIWLAVRRLHQGSVHWPRPGDTQIELSAEQVRALVVGLPWHRLDEYESIALL